MEYHGPYPSLGLILIVLTVLAVLVAIIAAVRGKHGAAPILGTLFIGSFVLAALLAVGIKAARQVQTDFGGMPQLVELAAPSAPEAPKAEVIADAELAAIAAAEPKIDLDAKDADAYRREALEAAQKAWDAERIRANDEAYGADAEAKRIKFLEAAMREEAESPRAASDPKKPGAEEAHAWIHGDVAENQTVITSGPFTTAESCKVDAKQQLLFWLPFMKDVAPSEADADTLRELLASQTIDLDQFIKAQHAETRDTSVGEVHLLYTLAEMNPELEAKVEKAVNDARIEKTQTDRIGAVTVLGAGVVSLVALAHVVLRAGGRQAGSNAP